LSIVLDCSVAMNWLMPDESSPFAEEVLERVALDGAFVPPLFKVEVGNALLLAVRRKRITPGTRRMAFDRIGALPLKEDGQGAAHVWTDCVDLADKHGLSLYDATYLELAIRLRKPLATLDDRLADAARQANLPHSWPDVLNKESRP
jgi:predicted nucleic acid-binding protein